MERLKTVLMLGTEIIIIIFFVTSLSFLRLWMIDNNIPVRIYDSTDSINRLKGNYSDSLDSLDSLDGQYIIVDTPCGVKILDNVVGIQYEEANKDKIIKVMQSMYKDVQIIYLEPDYMQCYIPDYSVEDIMEIEGVILASSNLSLRLGR